MATPPHLIPNTAEWHAFNVGMLIVQLQELEFSARVLLVQMTGSQLVDLRSLQPGDLAPEDPMTNWDALATVLKKFNEKAAQAAD